MQKDCFFIKTLEYYFNDVQNKNNFQKEILEILVAFYYSGYAHVNCILFLPLSEQTYFWKSVSQPDM